MQLPKAAFSIEDSFVLALDQKIAKQARQNCLWALVLSIELVVLLALLPFFIQSALLALVVAFFVLTIFGYLMLNQYFESQKSAYFAFLLTDLQNRFHSMQSLPTDDAKAHVELAKLSLRLADRLFQREYDYYPLPKSLAFLSPWNERLSASLHWKDLFKIRELLLQLSVDEHLKLVRKEPTSPDAHALLANAYVMLSGIYIDPKKIDPEAHDRWIPKQRYGKDMQEAFKQSAEKAVEEFKILKEYAPHDPWIYTQLAYSYRDLQMHEEEKAAYEAILELKPDDHEVQFKLGTLYFKQGENARGLKIFEQLKKARYSRANELLTAYGARKE